MSYWELYYHLVWSTKRKLPLITPALEPLLYSAIEHKCAELGCSLRAIGGMPDHIHLLVSIPPSISLAEFVRQVKGFSSRRAGEGFQWQAEYGAFTVSKRNLSAITEYVENQHAHHNQGHLYLSHEPPDDHPL